MVYAQWARGVRLSRSTLPLRPLGAGALVHDTCRGERPVELEVAGEAAACNAECTTVAAGVDGQAATSHAKQRSEGSQAFVVVLAAVYMPGAPAYATLMLPGGRPVAFATPLASVFAVTFLLPDVKVMT